MSSLFNKVVSGVKAFAEGAGSIVSEAMPFESEEPVSYYEKALVLRKKSLEEEIIKQRDTLEVLEQLKNPEKRNEILKNPATTRILNETDPRILENLDNLDNLIDEYQTNLSLLERDISVFEDHDEGIQYLQNEQEVFERTYRNYIFDARQALSNTQRQIQELHNILTVTKSNFDKFKAPEVKPIIERLCEEGVIHSNDDASKLRDEIYSAYVRLNEKLQLIQKEITDLENREHEALKKVHDAIVKTEILIRMHNRSLEKETQAETEALGRKTAILQQRLEDQEKELLKLQQRQYLEFKKTEIAECITEFGIWDELFDDKMKMPRDIDPTSIIRLGISGSDDDRHINIYEFLSQVEMVGKVVEDKVATMSHDDISNAIDTITKTVKTTDGYHLPSISTILKNQLYKQIDKVIPEEAKKEDLGILDYLKKYPYLVSQIATMFFLFTTFTSPSGLVAPIISITIARMVPSALKYCFGFTEEELTLCPFTNKLMTQAIMYAGAYFAAGPIGIALKAGYEAYSKFVLPNVTKVIRSFGFDSLINDDFTNIIIWGLFNYVTGKMLLTTVLTTGFLATNPRTAPIVKEVKEFVLDPVPRLKAIPQRFMKNFKFLGRAIKGFRFSEALGRTGATIAPIGIGAAFIALSPVGIIASSIIGVILAGFGLNTFGSRCNKKWPPEYTLDDMYEGYRRKQEEMKADFISKEKFQEEMKQLEELQKLDNEDVKQQTACSLINGLLGTSYSKEAMTFIVKAVDNQMKQVEVAPVA